MPTQQTVLATKFFFLAPEVREKCKESAKEIRGDRRHLCQIGSLATSTERWSCDAASLAEEAQPTWHMFQLSRKEFSSNSEEEILRRKTSP